MLPIWDTKSIMYGRKWKREQRNKGKGRSSMSCFIKPYLLTFRKDRKKK